MCAATFGCIKRGHKTTHEAHVGGVMMTVKSGEWEQEWEQECECMSGASTVLTCIICQNLAASAIYAREIEADSDRWWQNKLQCSTDNNRQWLITTNILDKYWRDICIGLPQNACADFFCCMQTLSGLLFTGPHPPVPPPVLPFCLNPLPLPCPSPSHYSILHLMMAAHRQCCQSKIF